MAPEARQSHAEALEEPRCRRLRSRTSVALGGLLQPASISCPRVVSRSSPIGRSRVTRSRAVRPCSLRGGRPTGQLTAALLGGSPEPRVLLHTAVGRRGVEVGPLKTLPERLRSQSKRSQRAALLLSLLTGPKDSAKPFPSVVLQRLTDAQLMAFGRAPKLLHRVAPKAPINEFNQETSLREECSMALVCASSCHRQEPAPQRAPLSSGFQHISSLWMWPRCTRCSRAASREAPGAASTAPAV